jgi:Putative serine dehydratase domain
MDADYGAIRQADGQRLPFAQALFVLATVVSANQPGQITVDAGTKALATNGPMPDCFRGLPDGARYAFGGDEHGIIKLPAGAPPLSLGARVLIGATHCDPTVNLHAGGAGAWTLRRGLNSHAARSATTASSTGKPASVTRRRPSAVVSTAPSSRSIAMRRGLSSRPASRA